MLPYLRFEYIKGQTIRIPFFTEWDLTDYTAVSELYDLQGNKITNLTVTISENPETTLLGLVEVTLNSTVSGSLEVGKNYKFDVQLRNFANEVRVIPKVILKIVDRVTTGV